MTKKALFLIASMIIFPCISATSQNLENTQSVKNDTFWNSVRFGGSLGLSFGNNYFSGELAPSALYDFNKTFSLGLGLNAGYGKVDNYKATSLGGSLIGLVRPIPQLQLSTEFQELYIDRKFEYIGANNVHSKDWVPALFLGLGYTNGPVTAGLKYDVLYDSDKSLYNSALLPFVSVYF